MVFNALADLFSPSGKRAREELQEQQERGDDHLLPGAGDDFYKGKITLKRPSPEAEESTGVSEIDESAAE